MIKMKCGVYGARGVMLRADDGAFSLTDSEEARLVNRGVAEYVIDHIPAEQAEDVPTIPAYDVGMTMKQLQGIAAYFGLDASKLRGKQAVVDLLDSHFGVGGEDDATGDAETSGEDGEAGEEGEQPSDDGADGEDQDAPSLGADLPTV
jgi:hypothetical protein